MSWERYNKWHRFLLEMVRKEKSSPRCSSLIGEILANAIVKFELGSYYSKSQQLPLAIQMLEETTELDPRHAKAFDLLAESYEAMSKPKQAKIAREAARELGEESTDANPLLHVYGSDL